MGKKIDILLFVYTKDLRMRTSYPSRCEAFFRMSVVLLASIVDPSSAVKTRASRRDLADW